MKTPNHHCRDCRDFPGESVLCPFRAATRAFGGYVDFQLREAASVGRIVTGSMKACGVGRAR